MTQLHDEAPGLNDFIRVRRTNHQKSRQRTQGSKLLYRLMCWPIFTQTDGIVSKDVDHGNFHDGSQPHRRARVIAEDQKTRTKWTNFAQRHSIQGGAHGVLADAEVKISSSIRARFEVSST